MEFKFTSYRALTTQLKRISTLLERLADDYEASMRQQGLEVPSRTKLTKEEARAEFSYTSEEDDALEEVRVAMGKPSTSSQEDEDV